MPGFDNRIKICFWQVVVKTVKSYNFKRPIIKFVDNLLIISNMDVQSCLPMLLYMIIPGYLDFLALIVNIECLIEA